MSAVYQGNVRDIAANPDSLLARMIETKISGHLALISEGTDDAGQQQELVYLKDSTIVACSSVLARPATDVLVADGVVSPEDAAAATSAAAARGTSPEDMLAADGKASAQAMASSIAAAVREAVATAMLQSFGLFVFKPNDNPDPPRALCAIKPADLALAYARSVESPSEFAWNFAQENAVLRLSPSLERLRGEVRFLPNEWKLLFRVNNRRTVREIMQSLEMSKEEFERVLYTCMLVRAVLTGEASANSATISANVREQASVAGAPGSEKGESSKRVAPKRVGAVVAPPSDVPISAAESLKAGLRESGERITKPVDPPDPSRLRRILVVDDSRTIQKMVAMALSELGELELEMADDGYEAIQYAEAKLPDLVILDVVMPRLDGYKTAERLRKVFGESKIPIIMLTAKDGTFNLIRGKLSGATAYMTKPFEPEELRRTVKEYLDMAANRPTT